LKRVSSISQTVWNLADNVKIRATAPWDQIYENSEGYVSLLNKFELAVFDLTSYTNTPLPLSSMNAFAKMRDTNSLQVEVKNPARRVLDGDGLVINLNYLPGGSEPVNWTVDIEFYSWDEWGWIDVAPQSVSLGIGASANISATISVPENAAAGNYDGALSIKSTPLPIANEIIS
jgi:hypothetical protein